MEDNSLEKLKQMVEVIGQKNYDLIALQEVNQPLDEEEIIHDYFQPIVNEPNPVPIKRGNFAGVLVDELKKVKAHYYWSWSANHIGYDKYDEGLALLSKTPFTAEAYTISHTTDYDSIYTRNILKGTTIIDGVNHTFFNGHFSWWKDFSGNLLFKEEWDRTLHHLKDENENNIIFMGDFNNDAKVPNEGYEYILDTAPFLRDSFKVAQNVCGEYTIPGVIDGWFDNSHGKRIDYIFVGEKMNVLENNIVFNGHRTPIVSDHYGVEVQIGKGK